VGDPTLPDVRSPDRTFGVLLTYRRPTELDRALSAIEAQSTPFDRLVVVDNDPGEITEAIVEGHRARIGPCSYEPAPSNLGAAGGRTLGVWTLASDASDDDWVVFLDDDDPLPADDLVERLVTSARRMRERDPTTAGVGLRGGRLDRRTGHLVAVDGPGMLAVDHLHGNRVPCYRFGDLRDVGAFDARLFFGFEELDLGLRLGRAGAALYVDGELYASVRGRMAGVEQHGPRLELGEPTLRRYYRLRNLLVILARDGRYAQAAAWGLVAGVLKPSLWLAVRPTVAWRHLRLNVAAIRDAAAGRLGPRRLSPTGKVDRP
jgi:glycosyltransferase involved in cell wall biosynthesis